jgi:hypothetical protein
MTTLGFVGSWLNRKNNALNRATTPAGVSIDASVSDLPANIPTPAWRPDHVTKRHLRQEHMAVCEVPAWKSLCLTCETGELWITTPQGEDVIVKAGEACPRLGPGTVIIQALHDSVYLWAVE